MTTAVVATDVAPAGSSTPTTFAKSTIKPAAMRSTETTLVVIGREHSPEDLTFVPAELASGGW